MKLKFTNTTSSILSGARDEAMRTGHLGIGTDHMVLALLRNASNEAVTLLEKAGVDTRELKRFIDSRIFREESIPYSAIDAVQLSREGQSLLSMAAFEALKRGTQSVAPAHLLLAAALTKGTAFSEFLSNREIDYRHLSEILRQDRSAEVEIKIPDIREISGAIEEQLGQLINPGDKPQGFYS